MPLLGKQAVGLIEIMQLGNIEKGLWTQRVSTCHWPLAATPAGQNLWHRSRVMWDGKRVHYEPRLEKYKVLARMIEKRSATRVVDVECKKDGAWSLKLVFALKHTKDTVSVDNVQLGTVW